MIKPDTSENLAKGIFLAIGSNLGDRITNIERAKLLLIDYKIKVTKISNYYETLSWPDPKNPKFINIVLKVSCKFDPLELLNVCKKIEISMGRKKSIKNSPRVCDIDIIDYNGCVLKGSLNLPHIMMHKRNFVLFPLHDIEKNWIHPITKKNINKLIFSLPDNEIRSIKKI